MEKNPRTVIEARAVTMANFEGECVFFMEETRKPLDAHTQDVFKMMYRYIDIPFDNVARHSQSDYTGTVLQERKLSKVVFYGVDGNRNPVRLEVPGRDIHSLFDLLDSCAGPKEIKISATVGTDGFLRNWDETVALVPKGRCREAIPVKKDRKPSLSSVALGFLSCFSLFVLFFVLYKSVFQ